MFQPFNHLRWKRDRLDRDLDRELRYHLERRVAELLADGVSEPDARRRANLEIGGVVQVRDAVRDTWTWATVDAVVLDVRYAIRTLARRPGFTLGIGAVLTVALATNIAIFSVVNAVLLQPLPYPHPERLMSIETLWTNTGRVSQDVSGPDFLDWQAQGDVFEAMAAIFGEDDVATVVDNRAVFANDRYVSAAFFEVFGQSPAAGRLLTALDVPTGDAAPTVAVVAHQFATAHFGSAHAAIGKTISVYGAPLQIIGVATPGFRYPGAADLWVPWRTEIGGTNRALHNYQAVGTLKADASLARAQAQMRTIGDALAQQFPENRLKTTIVVPLQERLTSHVRDTLWLVMAASGVLLLIACANIASLVLARAAERSREIALRAALGAGRTRVARQLLTEAGLLTAISGAAGLLLATLLTQLLLALSPDPSFSSRAVRTDVTVLLFGLGISLLALLSFGVVPALRVSRLDLMDALKQGGAKVTASRGTARLRSVLVVAEVALSVVLLVTAGLLLRSFLLLQQVDLGFATDRVVVAYTQYVANSEPERRARSAFYSELLNRLRGVPGVSAAAGIAFLPMGREPRPARDVFVQGRPGGQPGERPQAEVYAVTPEYFATLEIPFRAGRDFDDTDTVERPPIAIVNEAFARAVFPGQFALGQHVRWTDRAPWMEIVGVVGDTRWQRPNEPPPPTIFVTSLQGIGGSLSIVARTSLDDRVVASTLRSLVHEANPTVPMRLETMDDLFASALAYPRFLTQMIGLFSALAALLAAVGLFSVLAYVVGQRRRELAVRRAVGAQTADVLTLIVAEGLRLTMLGLILGLVIAAAVTRLLQGILYGIGPWDVATYAGATAVLGLAALIATLLPAIRAAAIAPLVVLQQE